MPSLSRPRPVARHRLAWLRHSATIGTLTLAMLRGGSTAAAQAPLALGEEFRVGASAAGSQLSPSVGVDADGDFVIAWTGVADFGYDVHARRYTADGTPQGEEFQVNTFTTSFQMAPSVAMDADGNFVVAWESLGQDGGAYPGAYGIYAQRYAADGTPQGEEFQVNSFTTGSQRLATVGMDAEGDFVVAWTSDGQDGDLGGIFAQRYAADGTPQGEEFQVNTFTTSFQFFPSVDVDVEGDFIIAWESSSDLGVPQDGDYSGIFAQRYTADGIAQGDELQVNTFTTSSQYRPSVGTDAEGDFVVAWSSYGQDGGSGGVFAQRYAADGTPQGDEFQVSAYTTDSQVLPSVAMDADGDFVIAWQSYNQDGDHYGVFAQRYAADGTPQGDEFQVNTFTTGIQRRPSVGVDGDGDFVVAWQSLYQYGNDLSIYAQRFAASSVANEEGAALPTSLTLKTVFPNPVRDTATLRYALPTAAAVRLTVTDVLGRTVLTRAEGLRPPGEHEARLALVDLPSGLYVVRLDADGAAATQRITVVR